MKRYLFPNFSQLCIYTNSITCTCSSVLKYENMPGVTFTFLLKWLIKIYSSSFKTITFFFLFYIVTLLRTELDKTLTLPISEWWRFLSFRARPLSIQMPPGFWPQGLHLYPNCLLNERVYAQVIRRMCFFLFWGGLKWEMGC